MKTYRFLILVLSFNIFTNVLNAQEQQEAKPDKAIVKLIDKGLKAYDKANYNEAEIAFRKALAKDPLNAVASYNLGLTETELDKNLEAARFFKKAAKQATAPLLKSKAFFNEGNIWYQKKKYDKAVEAYKNALRNNPSDEEARYNLALAQMKLKQQQKKNKQNKKDQNKQQNKNQQNKDQKKQDQKKQDQKNKEQQKKNQSNKKDQKKQGQDKKDQKQKNKDQKNKDKNGKGDKKKDEQGKPKQDQKNKEGQDKKDQQKKNGSNGNEPQPKQGQGQKRKAKLTPQQVKQLLVALKNKENKTQKKVKARVLKGRGKKQKQDKDW